jgi:hypothetical protein
MTPTVIHSTGPARKLRPGAWACLMAAALLAVAGCANQDDPDDAPNHAAAPEGGVPYRVSVDFTPFYRNGPQQPNGPDMSLKKDARVAVLKRGYGYSQIRTSDGQVGYVGTSEITALSAEELAAERASQLALTTPQTPQKKSRAIVGEYMIPPEAGNMERLPEPEVKPTPNPAMFRY